MKAQRRKVFRRLTGVAAVVIVGIGIAGIRAASSADGMNADGMNMGSMSDNRWLPSWLGVAASAVLAGVVIVHLWHLIAVPAMVRVWHGAHVLMALGMIEMFLPTAKLIVPARIGQIAFGVAVLTVLGFVVTELLRGRRVWWLWPVVGVDMAAMLYMFALSATDSGWLSVLLVGWFVLQAVGWASGVLPSLADESEVGEPSSTAGPVVHAHAHAPSIRITLTVMSLLMAYMFLAMRVGMAPMSGQLPTMGGM
ncbi:MAG: DUF5134 domain-containing protein [Nakamurella sp.]